MSSPVHDGAKRAAQTDIRDPADSPQVVPSGHAEGRKTDGTDPPAVQEPRRHCVYRFYTADDELLYVGRTVRIASRISSHRREKDWWLEVARIEVDHCATRQESIDLELRVIRELGPRHNIAGNLGRETGGHVVPGIEVPAGYTTLEEFAARLKVPAHLLRRSALDSGELAHTEFRGYTVMRWDDIDAWLETRHVGRQQ